MMKVSTEIKIALLEDDQGIRDLLIMIFEHENYQVLAFDSVKSFHAGMRGNKADIFLLDVMLPDGNGMEVCEKLKSTDETAQTPVIMMSAHADLQRMKKMCKANDYIGKPFDIYTLNEKIRQNMLFTNK